MYWLSPEKFELLERETENIRRVELLLVSGEPFRPTPEDLGVFHLGDLFTWFAFHGIDMPGQSRQVANSIAMLLPRAAALDFRIVLGRTLADMNPADAIDAARCFLFLQPPTDLRLVLHFLYEALVLPERVGGAVILLA